MRLPEGVRDWDLVNSYLKFRKAVFVDDKAWPLYHAEDSEFEQYDTWNTTYVIAHRDRAILGGARLRRTDDMTGTYSYMIKDAYDGLLPGMPIDLCAAKPPVSRDVWELTRMAVVPQEPGVAKAILAAANKFLESQGARECLFLGSPAFLRMARRVGWPARPLGKIVGNADGHFLAFSCPVGRQRPRSSLAS